MYFQRLCFGRAVFLVYPAFSAELGGTTGEQPLFFGKHHKLSDANFQQRAYAVVENTGWRADRMRFGIIDVGLAQRAGRYNKEVRRALRMEQAGTGCVIAPDSRGHVHPDQRQAEPGSHVPQGLAGRRKAGTVVPRCQSGSISRTQHERASPEWGGPFYAFTT